MDRIIDDMNMAKLKALNNPHVMEIVEEYVRICKPSKVKVITDSKEDKEYIRNKSIERGEEKTLSTKGHTYHFDGANDQGRDTANTRILIPKGVKISKFINTLDRDEGVKEALTLLDGIMKGREMLVAFFCLGPVNAKFSISALQITDSFYVLHSEDILYRNGYDHFKNMNGSDEFFHFVHSTGELENGVCKNIDKRRIYMDLMGDRVFTINNSYAGNSVGLKKLALRLAIHKSSKEDWLCEHMFISGFRSLDGKRTTYFTGAYPSMCGKTSTAMVPGNTIVGDDIAYIRPGADGSAYAANVERGIFGIIKDVNSVDDPAIYKSLTTEREVIFSNVLIHEGSTYWTGMGKDIPAEGTNFSGKWNKGALDKNGKAIPSSHENSRFTLRISELDNADPKLEDPNGVKIDGFVYGGRDSSTSVPVMQSLSWAHGVFLGACLESETTAATLGKEGERKHDPMANIDFLVIPLGMYIRNHLKFGDDLAKTPLIFATNYFLKEDGKFLNDKTDKKVWLIWMEGRVHGDYDVIETPIGMIPKHDDIKDIFKKVFKKDFTKQDYERQFGIRIPHLMSRLDRMEKTFKEEDNIPDMFFAQLNEQRERLMQARKKFGKDVISPFEFE